jgi:excisionase family DNA binding protein
MGSARQQQTSRGAPNPTHYTLAEAARVLGVHYETAARWARTGKLRSVKLSRRKVVVPREGCEALLSGGAPNPPRKPASTEWWLPLIGTLTPREGAAVRAAVAELFEQVEDLD